jgi:alpha-D-ribose 1-methylphosphonate 5-triphosphate synthase subunit PhnG
MEKQRLFRILSKADYEEINNMSNQLALKYGVIIIKDPSKTLAMIKMREPVKSGLFYLGEVIVSETIVELGGVKGMAVTIGDDYNKVLSMAIIDAAFNKNADEVTAIEEQLLLLEQKQHEEAARENAMCLKTMVSFNSMDGEARE